jgi:oxygen-independent coproporphyrinogen-3 oxidase
MLDTFAILTSTYFFDSTIEITLEVNPENASRRLISFWREIRINRISLGGQSLNQNTLFDLNRQHSVAATMQAIHNLNNQFDSLSIDLIVGLPGTSIKDWKQTLRTVLQWPIQHISLYFLSIHRSTPLYFSLKEGILSLPHASFVMAQYRYAQQMLFDAGFEQYEISNFAKPGHQSKHNATYWNRNAYRGIGLSACSFDGAKRTKNTSNLLSYITAESQNLAEGFSEEILTEKQHLIESFMLSMRMATGCNLEKMLKQLTVEQAKNITQLVKELLENNLVTKLGTDYIAITPKGTAVEHEIIMRISQCL